MKRDTGVKKVTAEANILVEKGILLHCLHNTARGGGPSYVDKLEADSTVPCPSNLRKEMW
jgi:hypothetical protein